MIFPTITFAPDTIVVAVVVVVAVFWYHYDTAKTIVHAELGRIHAKDVKIKSAWLAKAAMLALRRGHFTYDVTYTTRTGERVRNRCTVIRHVGEDDQVYWDQQLQVLPYKQ